MHVCNNKRPTGLKGHLSTITFRLTCQRVLGFIVNPCGWMGGGRRGESEDGGILKNNSTLTPGAKRWKLLVIKNLHPCNSQSFIMFRV